VLTATEELVESPRLEALIRHSVGWQVDDLEVMVGEAGVVLRGHAHSALARHLVEEEAERLTGLPVLESHIDVS